MLGGSQNHPLFQAVTVTAVFHPFLFYQCLYCFHFCPFKKGKMWVQCLLLLLLMTPTSVTSQSLQLNKFLKTASITEGPTLKGKPRLSNPYMGHDGRVYACSGKSLLVYQSNGSVVWIIPLNYFCNSDITPVADERGKIYLVGEERVLKITPSNMATASESQVEILFGPDSAIGGSGEIIGLGISVLYSSLFVTVKNRGLFSILLLRGELLWSAGPLLYRFGYRQGCKENTEDCFFNSAPVVDQCEGTLYITNTEGLLYSVYINSPHFRWIQDFSGYAKLMTIVAGNNGRLYVIFPGMASLMALDVSTGNVLWKNDVGPLSTDRSLPIVDSNGWISIGSLDGFLYSFSPTGELKKYLEPTATDSVIQVSPVLDCSGFGVYISQTLMEAKSSLTISNYTYISAMKPIDTLFTLLTPATGTVYWSGKYSGEVSSLVSKSDLRHFAPDDRILLIFLTSARIGSTLPCYTARQKISWTCSQVKPKASDIYTSSEGAILLLLLFQFVVLVILAVSVRFCCIFWRKKKLQDHGLIGFLEKRRFLHKRKKTFNRMISELEQKAAEDSASNEEALEQLGEAVRAKEGVERRLSACYSLGSDRHVGPPPQRGSILPVHGRGGGGRAKSHSFHSARKGSLTIFSTLSDSSATSAEKSSNDTDGSSDSRRSGEQGVVVEMEMSAEPACIDRYGNEGMGRRRMWLKRRRTLSSTN